MSILSLAADFFCYLIYSISISLKFAVGFTVSKSNQNTLIFPLAKSSSGETVYSDFFYVFSEYRDEG